MALGDKREKLAILEYLANWVFKEKTGQPGRGARRESLVL